MEKRKRKTDDQGETEEDFKDHFPSLFREIREGEERIIEEEMRTSTGSKKERKFRGYYSTQRGHNRLCIRSQCPKSRKANFCFSSGSTYTGTRLL